MFKATDIFEKEFLSQKNPKGGIDTLGAAMTHIHRCFDEIATNFAQKAEVIQRDLVEPIELYYKHYFATNQELLK